MKTLAYLECPTGIAGDMCLGALVHAGVPLTYLQAQLARLGIQDEFNLRADAVLRNQQAATKVHVELLSHNHDHLEQVHDHQHSHAHSHHEHSHHAHSHHEHEAHTHHHSRRLPDIETIIQQAELPERVTQWSLAIFRQLGKAEAAVHGIPPEQVHFHEVGATDAIVDIVGTCLGLDWLNIDSVVCSPLPTGGGTVRCDHGLLPVPAPAVLHMMMSANVPVYSNGIEKELVTPTGCAIATTLATSFGPPPRFTLQKIGLGSGGRDLTLPNILRLWIGQVDDETASHATPPQSPSKSQQQSQGGHVHTDHAHEDHAHISETHAAETHAAETHAASHQHTNHQHTAITNPELPATEIIIELQTQIDDCSPQAIGYLFEQLFAIGAVDVFSQAVAMKKNRLGTLLSVLCPENLAIACETLIFQETTTLGIRRTQQTRAVLAREMVTVTTPYGNVSVKVARTQKKGSLLNIQPEYEDCAQLAKAQNIPWQQVHQAAIAASNNIAANDPIQPQPIIK